MAERLHIVVTHAKGKPTVAYIGDGGADADKAYDGAKGVDLVEHFRFPEAQRHRSGDKPTRETVINSGKAGGK